MTDHCPDCGGLLKALRAGRITWTMKCRVCGQEWEFNDQFDPVRPTPAWHAWIAALVLPAGMGLASWLESIL